MQPLRVLSIQSNVLGHTTYGNSIRRYLSAYDDIDLTACWFHDGRSFPTQVVNRLARVSVPGLSGNRDYWRARVEWSEGRMARLLAQKKIAERPCDLLHFNTQVQALGSTALMKKIPTVVAADMTVMQYAREKTTRYPATLEPGIRIERRVFEAAAHIVSWSDWARRSIIEDYGIPESKVTRFYPGARLETLREPRLPDIAPHTRDTLRVLFVGNDFQRKGGWDLLGVFQENFAQEAAAGAIALDIMTGHPLTVDTPGVTVHRGIGAYSEPWHDLFQNADVFVMPSYGDAFPSVFQEAAGYGLALIGTNVCGIPEMIEEGGNGFRIEPGEREALNAKLRFFLNHRADLSRMRHRSREVALERFDSGKNFRAMADLFHRVAGK